MGKFHNGVLGTMTGKVGGVVGRTWKGINTVASYQPNVANPQTNAQMSQRGKLSALTTLASLINTGFIKPLWDRDAKKMSGFNAFIQANMSAVSAEGVIDFSKIIASKGKMEAPSGIQVVPLGNNLTIQYSDVVTDSYGLASDKLFCAVVNTATNEVFISSGIASRADGSVTLSVPSAIDFAGVIYSAFRRADGSIVSNSSYYAI